MKEDLDPNRNLINILIVSTACLCVIWVWQDCQSIINTRGIVHYGYVDNFTISKKKLVKSSKDKRIRTYTTLCDKYIRIKQPPDVTSYYSFFVKDLSRFRNRWVFMECNKKGSSYYYLKG